MCDNTVRQLRSKTLNELQYISSGPLLTVLVDRYDSEGHCYIAHLHINSLRIMDSGNFALQLDNSEGGIQRSFHITVTTPIISETASLWFFVLFFFACFLLVASRFTHLGLRSKPAVLV